MRKGFTLIELLVVVLIIGILAGAAVPQYQKAVEKGRSAEALANLRALVQAEQLYKMANSVAARELDALDFELKGERVNERTVRLKNFTYDIRNFDAGFPEGFEAVATRNDGSNDVMKYYIYFGGRGQMNCVAKTSAAEVICAAMCGNSNFHDHSSPGWRSCSIQ